LSYKQEYQRWLDSPVLEEAEWAELAAIQNNDDEIKSRFACPLQFGTAGLRGVMGMGINRMNIHVVRQTTQAFANVIAAEGESAMSAGVVICYDCRKNSELFAQEAARVMAANGIFVRIFESLRPTPELSFAIRHYGAAAGINITASHNPKEYNGYKVYWSDGAQLPPERAAAIAEQMRKTDVLTGAHNMGFGKAQSEGKIVILGKETDEAFLEKVLAQAINPQCVSQAADKLKIVYTPFHGAGHKLVPEALGRLGVRNLIPVPEQMVIDGAFPTVDSPNPENPEGFYLAVELARREGAELIIGTDPDSDRVGVMVLRGEDYVPITGNQMGVLLLNYIITARREQKTLPKNAAFIKTIVTTDMAAEIARQNGVYACDTFTGFKFMAEKIAQFERDGSYEYIMAYEESYGYMVGDFVRDKDAVTASVLIAEMASYYALRGMTLLDGLEELYGRYGWYKEKTINLVMPGLDGQERMAKLMERLRHRPPDEMADVRVLRLRDYQSGLVHVFGLGAVEETEIKGSNVLYFELENGSAFIVRPSGTEPKIKLYILVRGDSAEECDGKIAALSEYAASLAE
jgi:phosphoglucomutase